jgi:hypothetical protein
MLPALIWAYSSTPDTVGEHHHRARHGLKPGTSGLSLCHVLELEALESASKTQISVLNNFWRHFKKFHI